MPPKDKYTDPELRDKVKEELKASDKGGEPGQWSARKAQMMAAEYKKRGGGYTTDKKDKDESQQNLTNWGEEEWQTKDGEGKAKQDDGTEKRYLPKKAWEQMTEKEKEETDQKKQEESKQGKQHVANTPKAKDSRKKAQSNGSKNDGDDKATTSNQRGSRSQTKNAEAKKNSQGAAQGKSKDENEDDDDDDDSQSQEEPAKSAKTGQKRKNNEEHDSEPKSKTKKSNGTIGSKHMDATEPAQKGSKDRLPKEGQQIQWKAMPGWIDGKVKEILKKGKKVDEKQVKASEDDPKIVLISNKSGKICVHKPEACYYDDE
ncbi:hypothetical protein CB0940_01362 [Cercospora beticola]|uniref:Hypervirulence associated protein TUDOR domain-containing protein n=1 Tax=Cercospora beticola TaxID=122368 RepID=A0A2G5I9S6_CERBT|nr:hypothetical protein CB0940_01362 [Cercospora beticola]PIB01462.1 hypothetical protein CB0940_01362 [Cercospora beticola]WPA96799.1 hypothetical protein RHO25_001407 [Cercospora beticola]CAK1354831.1 unnamed protein product [Cercospora beticola]